MRYVTIYVTFTMTSLSGVLLLAVLQLIEQLTAINPLSRVRGVLLLPTLPLVSEEGHGERAMKIAGIRQKEPGLRYDHRGSFTAKSEKTLKFVLASKWFHHFPPWP